MSSTRRDLMKKSGGITLGVLAYGRLGTGKAEAPKRKKQKYETKDLKRISELIAPEDEEVREIAEETRTGYLSELVIKYPDTVEFKPRSDELVYDRDDRWASPSTYIQNDFRGDCEDHAIFTTSVLQALESDSGEFEARCIIDLENEHVNTELKYQDERWITDVRAPEEFFPKEVFKNTAEWSPNYMITSQMVEEYSSEWE